MTLLTEMGILALIKMGTGTRTQSEKSLTNSLTVLTDFNFLDVEFFYFQPSPKHDRENNFISALVFLLRKQITSVQDYLMITTVSLLTPAHTIMGKP